MTYTLLGLALLGAPLMAGTVHVLTTAVVALLCLAAAASVEAGLLGRRARAGVDPLAGVLFAVLVWQALSLVPLPDGPLHMLSPDLAGLLAFPDLQAVAGGQLSYTPGSTLWELLKIGGALAAFLLAAGLARHPVHARLVLACLGVTTAVVMAVWLLQTFTGTSRVLWIYQPIAGAALGKAAGVVWGFRSTFINPNHAAQYLELCGLAILAFGLFGRGRWQGLWIALGAVAVASVYLTGSRGGRVVVVVALVFLALLWIARRWQLLAPIRYVVPCALLVFGTLTTAVVVLAGHNGTPLPEIVLQEGGDPIKGDSWTGTVRMIEHHPWTGIGRGSFRDGIPRYRDPEVGLTRTHTFAENEYLQLTAELGILVGPLLFGAFLLTWAIALVRWRGSAPQAAALTGTLAIGVHSFAGFGVEFAGVGLPFIVLMGVCAAGAWRRGLTGIPGTTARRVLFAATLTTLVLTPWAHQHGSFSRAAREVLDQPEGATDEAALATLLRWRPVSADLSLAIAGHHAARQDLDTTLHWLRRTMELAPLDPTPHAAAVRPLLATGERDLALIALGSALERTPASRESLYQLMIRARVLRPEVETLLQGNPTAQAEFATYLLMQDQGVWLAREIAADLADEPDREVQRLVARVAWKDGERETAIATMTDAVQADPHDMDNTLLLVTWLRIEGDHDAAGEVLQRALSLVPDDPRLWLARAEVEAAAGRPPRALTYVRRARALTDPRQVGLQSRIHAVEGDVDRQRGDLYGARDAYADALQLRPGDTRVRVRLGGIYEELEQPQAALREYRRVVDEGGGNARVTAAIERLEAAD